MLQAKGTAHATAAPFTFNNACWRKVRMSRAAMKLADDWDEELVSRAMAAMAWS